MYQKHMFAKSYDPLSKKFYPILVSPKGFVKIFVPCMGKYLSSAGYLSKKAKYYRVSVKQKNGKKNITTYIVWLPRLFVKDPPKF